MFIYLGFNEGYTPEFVLRSGEFEVLMCVDNTETTGGGAGGRWGVEKGVIFACLPYYDQMYIIWNGHN